MRNEAMPSYASGPAAAPLLGLTIGQMLEDAAARHPDREALVETASGRRWTFAQLLQDAQRLALGLTDLGVVKGDRVGIWAPNCAEWVLTQYATALIGAILVNVNPAYRTHEVHYAITQSGMRLIVSATQFRTTDYRGMLEEVGYDDVVYIGTPGWDDVMARGDQGDRGALERIGATLAFDEPINIQYTSGTTGYPKGATLSHHNILNNGFLSAKGCTSPPKTGCACRCRCTTASGW